MKAGMLAASLAFACRAAVVGASAGPEGAAGCDVEAGLNAGSGLETLMMEATPHVPSEPGSAAVPGADGNSAAAVSLTEGEDGPQPRKGAAEWAKVCDDLGEEECESAERPCVWLDLERCMSIDQWEKDMQREQEAFSQAQARHSEFKEQNDKVEKLKEETFGDQPTNDLMEMEVPLNTTVACSYYSSGACKDLCPKGSSAHSCQAYCTPLPESTRRRTPDNEKKWPYHCICKEGTIAVNERCVRYY